MFKEFSLGCLVVGSVLNSYSLSLNVARCITRLSFKKRSIESAFIEYKVYWKHITVETRIAQKPNQ